MSDEHLPPGTLVAERYRIGERLGEGGMGAVYQAEHVRVGRSVAVKVLAARWIDEEEIVRRFRDEARAASAAGHPNIIEVFDAGELPDGRPYLVMEHLSGREIYEVIEEEGALETVRACRIMCDVARALEAAHAAGIIHRDLKTENVMLVERGGRETVKVLDFGIAANASGARSTVAGQVMGTPTSMAPEQVKGALATTAFDVYAIGVMLHEVLTGVPPFSGRGGMELMVLKTSEPAPSIASLVGDLPKELVLLVDACLALDPERRPSVHEIVEQLDQLAQGRRIWRSAGHTTIVAPPPEAARPQRRWLVPLAAMVTMLIVGAGAWGLYESAAASGSTIQGEPIADAPSIARTLPTVEALPTNETLVEAPPDAVEALPDAGAGLAARSSSSPLPADPRPATAKDEPKPVASLPSLDPPDPEPAPTSGLCSRKRKQAQQAREAHDWSGVLRHTRELSCWAEQRSERGRLRTKAFMELGRWSECIGASRGLGDERTLVWRRTCEKRQEQP